LLGFRLFPNIKAKYQHGSRFFVFATVTSSEESLKDILFENLIWPNIVLLKLPSLNISPTRHFQRNISKLPPILSYKPSQGTVWRCLANFNELTKVDIIPWEQIVHTLEIYERSNNAYSALFS